MSKGNINPDSPDPGSRPDAHSRTPSASTGGASSGRAGFSMSESSMQSLAAKAGDFGSRLSNVSSGLRGLNFSGNALGPIGLFAVPALNNSNDKAVERADSGAKAFSKVQSGIRATAETSAATDRSNSSNLKAIDTATKAKPPPGGGPITSTGNRTSGAEVAKTPSGKGNSQEGGRIGGPAGPTVNKVGSFRVGGDHDRATSTPGDPGISQSRNSRGTTGPTGTSIDSPGGSAAAQDRSLQGSRSPVSGSANASSVPAVSQNPKINSDRGQASGGRLKSGSVDVPRATSGRGTAGATSPKGGGAVNPGQVPALSGNDLNKVGNRGVAPSGTPSPVADAKTGAATSHGDGKGTSVAPNSPEARKVPVGKAGIAVRDGVTPPPIDAASPHRSPTPQNAVGVKQNGELRGERGDSKPSGPNLNKGAYEAPPVTAPRVQGTVSTLPTGRVRGGMAPLAVPQPTSATSAGMALGGVQATAERGGSTLNTPKPLESTMTTVRGASASTQTTNLNTPPSSTQAANAISSGRRTQTANLAPGTEVSPSRRVLTDRFESGTDAEVDRQENVRVGRRRGKRLGPADFRGELPTDKPPAERPTVSDPVDVSTGEILLEHTDVTLPGVLPFVLRRTHVSSQRTGFMFGRAWTSTIDQRLIVKTDQVIMITDIGMIMTYQRPGPGLTALPTSGPLWALRQLSEDEWVITVPGSSHTNKFRRSHTDPESFLISSVTNKAGHVLSVIRSDDDTPVSVHHHGGYILRLESTDGLVEKLWMETGQEHADVLICQYFYDDSGSLTNVTDSSGLSTSYRYDSQGRLCGWHEPNGMWYQYGYDSRDRCVRTTGADGYLSANFHYDDEERRTVYTDAVGSTWIYQLDDKSRVIGKTDPLGERTNYRYDTQGRIASVEDPLGATTRFVHSAEGDLLSRVEANGLTTAFQYDEDRRLVTTVYPDGTRTSTIYRPDGLVRATVDQAGASTTYAYREDGTLESITDALGGVARVETNPAGLPTLVTDASGRTTRYAYDVFGRSTAIRDASGAVTRITWTVGGKPLSITDPSGTVSRWTYTSEGALHERFDSAGRASRVERGRFGLPLAEFAADGTHVRYTFDSELRLVAVTNQQGMIWRFERDAAGRTVREIDYDGRIIHYARDAAGRVAQRTNAIGQVVKFERDLLGRTVTRTVDGSDTRLSYTPAGHVATVDNDQTTVRFSYDNCGRVIEETINGRSVRSSYDLLGRRIQRRTPSGLTSTWSYDSADRPVTLQVADTEMSFGYDLTGREVARNFGDGFSLVQRWSIAGQLESQMLVGRELVVQQRSYTYHPDGSPYEVLDELGGHWRTEIDTLGRITALHRELSAANERYTYDLAGNLAGSQIDAFPHLSGIRGYRGSRLSQVGQVHDDHDLEGRVVARNYDSAWGYRGWSYHWDAEDRLTAVTTPDGNKWKYEYDGLGRRTSKKRYTATTAAPLETILFFWDGDRLAEELRTDGVATSWEYRPGCHQVLTQARVQPSHHGTPPVVNAVISNSIGTPMELVSSGGEVVWRNRWTLWGLEPDHEPDRESTPIRFPGQYFDAETGLHYNLYRYYDPVGGQYFSNDPMGLAPGPNSRYYVLNPLTWSDPQGLDPITAGRADKQIVFSGHGGIGRDDNSTVIVPEGTTLHFYSQHGQEITDRLGNAIEMGFEKHDPTLDKFSHGPGTPVPDYMFKRPAGLTTYGNPVTTVDATRLSAILKPNMGDVHWAACRSVN